MDKQLYTDIIDAMKNRADFESKQEGFYRMRFGGIKRSKKPYPNAPDMHYPLADSTIDKLKPLFIQQLYANDTLAQFVATVGQDPGKSTMASEWFDYQLKQCSNFEEEIFSGIDQAQECGFITIKCYTKKSDLCFSVVDNLHTVVPSWTEDLQDADWFVHIIPVSVAQYKRNKNYTDKSDDFIKSITGKGEKGGDEIKKQLADLREGLAYSTEQNQIIVWEVWHRDENDNWQVDTISPIKGWDTALRPSFKNPFKHGNLPFFRIRTEITKKGWYTSRGVPEVLGPFQMGLKKLWDGSLQFVDFNCLPTYKNNGTTPLPNAENYRSTPGGVLPPGIDGATNPTAPIDFQVQMGNMRAIAEDRISVPDLGSPIHLSPGRGSRGETTATQINAEVNISGQGNDMRARVFKLDLAKGYKLAWLTLIDIKKDDLQYLLATDLKELDPTALHENYAITPNGSPDSWNKPAQFQKAVTRYQLFRGDPFVNQAELRKGVFELDGSGAVKRYFQDPGAELADQAEQQAQEISIMLLGYKAAVKDADDDKAHLKSIDDFVKFRSASDQPFGPGVAGLLLQHGADHMAALQRKKDPMLGQVEALTAPTVQFLQMVMQQQQQLQLPSNVLPMQPAGGPAQPGGLPFSAPASPSAAPGGKDDPIGDAAKLMNGLSALIKAGVNVSQGEINAAMEMAGLPPLPMAPVAPPAPHRPPGALQPQPETSDEAA